MAFRNLRDYVRALEKERELLRISAAVNPELEITEITDRISKGPHEQNKALLFEHVSGSDMPVLINAFGSERRMSLALNVDQLDDLNHNLAKVIDMRLPRGLAATLGRAGDMLDVLRSVGLKPKVVNKAPVQEVVITQAPFLSRLPILKCWPLDGGRYITLMQVITRDPATGVRNVGMYRLQVRDDPDADDALAAPQGRRRTRARGSGNAQSADSVRHCFGWRPGQYVVRFCTFAAQHRRVSAGRLSARQTSGVRQVPHPAH